jgi:hypothetical protein
MQYPLLNNNSKAINLASKDSYSCLYDIVWSFDYAISGNPSTEAGFTVFLMSENYELSGGSTGIDLGYSGLSSTNLPYSVKPGISGAILAVGFDTTGLFAASAFDGSFIRDGVGSSSISKNSVIMRGGTPDYKYSDFSYNVPLTSLNTTFSIVESAAIFKTVRARLGNVGSTLYIDYRNSPDEDFQPIFKRNITLSVPVSSYVKVGVSFATPISSSNVNSIGNIYLKNLSIEGTINPNLSSTTFTNTSVILPLNENTLVPGITSVPEIFELEEPGISVYPPVTDPYPARKSGSDLIGLKVNVLGGSVAGVNTIEIPKCENIAVLPDLYNFGYKIKVVETNTILTRTGYFTYTDGLSSIVQLTDYISGWTLNDGLTSYSNSSQTPIGLYTGVQNLSVIYINE